jgi:hypothetical protein
VKVTSSKRVFVSCSDNRQSKIQNRKLVGLVVFAFAFALCGAVTDAQQTGKIFRIGILDASTASGSAVLVDAFRQELSKLGWIEGKNITIEYRFAEQKSERIPDLAADLVRLKVDLIVVQSTQAALAAKKATTTIPIVMTSGLEPVAAGLVDSLARPGGNVTGLASLAPELNNQKARDTQRCGPQTRPSWSSTGANRRSSRPPTEGAQACGSGTEAKIGRDRDSS